MTQDVLRNVLQHDDRAITIEIIQKHVADYYQLKLTELKSRNNSKSVATASADRDVSVQDR